MIGRRSIDEGDAQGGTVELYTDQCIPKPVADVFGINSEKSG